MGDDNAPLAPRVESADSALASHLVVRNLDTGEARPLAAGTAWTTDRPAAPLTSRTRRRIAGRTRSDVSCDVSAAAMADSVLKKNTPEDGRSPILCVPVRVTAHKKARPEFRSLRRFQTFRAHLGPVRALACSPSGLYLASAGADARVNVWFVAAYVPEPEQVPSPTHSARPSALHSPPHSPRQTPPTPQQPPASPLSPLQSVGSGASSGSRKISGDGARDIKQQNEPLIQGRDECEDDGTPYITFLGHTMEVVDLSWSKNDFLLTASLDKTMRLWHPSGANCLRRFVHPDFVTSVTFHPQDEQICVSGTADGVVRLWHIKERKLLSEAESDEMITALTISPCGTKLLTGTICGRCKFYNLFDEIQGEWRLTYTMQMDVRSTRGKNKKGVKICGITFRMDDPSEVLISSADSRIRLYRMDDKSIVNKYAGHTVAASQLSASFSPCGRYILSGSEQRSVCIWRADDETGSLASAPGRPQDDGGQCRRDRSVSYEAFSPHDHDGVCAACFAPARYFPRRAHVDPAPGATPSSGLIVFSGSDTGEIAGFACL